MGRGGEAVVDKLTDGGTMESERERKDRGRGGVVFLLTVPHSLQSHSGPLTQLHSRRTATEEVRSWMEGAGAVVERD